jgi:hypothetical protein
MDNVDLVNRTFRSNGYSYHAEHARNGMMDIYDGPSFVVRLPVSTSAAQVLQTLNCGGSTTVVVDRGPSFGQCVAEGVGNGLGFGLGVAAVNSMFGHGHDTVIHETVVIDDSGGDFFDD